MCKVKLLLPLMALFSLPLHAQDFFDPYAAPLGNPDSLKAFNQEHDVIDTLPTKDKYVKVVLYSDYSWAYFDEDRPVIDTSGFFDGWDSEMIHAFKGEPLSSLPDSVEVLLTDETHKYHAPYLGKVISGFKYRGRHPHNGVDLPLNTGDTIRAAFDGIVRYAGVPGETGGYGNLLVIRHDNGLETYYGHLSAKLVQVDDPVRAGEVIALGGNTGHSTGPHLHFETRYHGKPFDPQRVFDFEKGTVRDSVLLLRKDYFSLYSHYGQTSEQSAKAAMAKAPSPNVYHRVRQGDTLSKIARRYGTSVNALCRLNHIKSTSVLRPGQRLLVRK